MGQTLSACGERTAEVVAPVVPSAAEAASTAVTREGRLGDTVILRGALLGAIVGNTSGARMLTLAAPFRQESGERGFDAGEVILVSAPVSGDRLPRSGAVLLRGVLAQNAGGSLYLEECSLLEGPAPHVSAESPEAAGHVGDAYEGAAGGSGPHAPITSVLLPPPNFAR